ncbi:hypothetical protein [Yersinia bercovieri]|uniref:hypothetical protein n=1 Tax=Yersinia bercovieri TaxID=634 RepID=UPI0005E461B6|nr:hypothetical protein [Yersinia bercovieri]CNJ11199.1 Uncharacterised protein [Yersinia bercovieri]
MTKLTKLDLSNILNDMATILDCAAILRGDPNQGAMLANELDAYVEDYARITAARIVKEEADHE